MSSSLLSTLSRSLRGRVAAGANEGPQLALRTRKADDEGPQNPLEWATLYRRLEDRPFSLARHLPLEGIYSDPHEHIVIIKPAQRGASEYAINYAAFALDRGAEVWTKGEKNGLNVAYIFPKKEALGDFSKERLSGLANESPYLTKLFGDDEFNAVTFKQIRDSYLYLRGGWSTSALKSFPADFLVLDEYDEMASSAIALARRRLNASLVHRELDLSTPSSPGRGIHEMFRQSDQHVYLQRHSSCGAWVRYDFLRDLRCDGQSYDQWESWAAEQIRRVSVLLHCPNCNGIVTDEDRLARGRWVAEAPDVQGLRGYWLPPMAFPVANLVRMAAAAVNPDPFEREQFFQSDLGLPYAVGGSKITPEMVQQLSSPLEGGRLPQWAAGEWKDNTMGLDIGARWHWKVSGTGPDGRRYMRAAGAASSWQDVDGLMRHFRIRRCVVDALPELDGSKQFSARWPGRVLRAFYPGPSALKGQLFHVEGLTELQQKKRKRGVKPPDVVQINRTMAMDRVQMMVHRISEPAPVEITRDPEFEAHLCSPTKTVVVDTKGQPTPSWVHEAPDHYFHSLVYDVIARETLPPAAAGSFHGAAGGNRVPGGETGPQMPFAERSGGLPRPQKAQSRRQALRNVLSAAQGPRAGAMGGRFAPPERYQRNKIL